MTRQETEQQAFTLISSGFNCAEAVLQAGMALFDIAPDGTPSRVATCFGGGLGRCKQELCGALAGGAMALGLAFGRDRAGEPCDLAQDLAALLRERFIQLHGTSTCGQLLAHFGPQENWTACKGLVAATAGILHDLRAETAD